MRLILPPCVTLAELVESLGADEAVLFAAEQLSDLLPGPAALTLLANEVQKRFESAVKGPTATGTGALCERRVIHSFRIHQRRAYDPRRTMC
jgi:hypothetical protein